MNDDAMTFLDSVDVYLREIEALIELPDPKEFVRLLAKTNILYSTPFAVQHPDYVREVMLREFAKRKD